MRSTKNGYATEVIGTVCLDGKGASETKPTWKNIPDVASLDVHLPAICSYIFEQIGSQQLEATYQRCLRIELEAVGVTVTMEPELHLTYKNVVVGTRRADLLLEMPSGETAIIELKAVNEMKLEHRKQLEYYLHHANVQKGYLVNFPHDSSFPSVDDKSSFTTKVLLGLKKKVEHLLGSGPSLRLRNCSKTRQVEVLEVTRKLMNEREQASARQEKQETPAPRFGVKANGEECTICIREQRFCRFHVGQKAWQ